MNDKDWTIVYSTNTPFQAEMVKQMLESNGIEAVVIDKQDSSYPSIGEAEVYVTKEIESKAKQLINELEL